MFSHLSWLDRLLSHRMKSVQYARWDHQLREVRAMARKNTLSIISKGKLKVGNIKPRSPGKPDVELGKRIRLRRVEMEISQAELADQLGVSFQQVQKYEKGVN